MLRFLVRLVGRLFGFDKKNEESDELISFVLLLRKAEATNVDRIKAAVAAVHKAQGITGQPEVTAAAVPGACVAELNEEHNFLVISHPDPYADLGETAKQIEDEKLRELWWAHTAWLSVDVMLSRETPAFNDSVRYAALIAKELLSDNCVLLYIPSMQRLAPNDEELIEKLTADDPFGVATLNRDGTIINAKSGDEEVNAAMEEARRRLPEFKQAFARRTGDDPPFMVKGRFEEPGIPPEHMWITAVEMDDESVTGILENKPNRLKTVRYKARVRITNDAVSDWIYAENDQTHGGFVERLFKKRAG